jgi:DNA-binding NarL/FixJ family response regulator
MNAVLAPALEQTAARPHAPTRLRVLCVDDEPYVTDGLARQLHRHYEVLGAASGAEGLEILHREGDIAVIVSDMCMPTTDGVSFLRLARDIAPDAARVVLSGHADTQSALEAINFGQVCAYLLKPCTVSALLGAVNAAAGRYRVNAAQRLLLDAASQEEHPTLEAVFARAVRHSRRLHLAAAPAADAQPRREPVPRPRARTAAACAAARRRARASLSLAGAVTASRSARHASAGAPAARRAAHAGAPARLAVLRRCTPKLVVHRRRCQSGGPARARLPRRLDALARLRLRTVVRVVYPPQASAVTPKSSFATDFADEHGSGSVARIEQASL